MRVLTGVGRLPALSRRKVSERHLLPREIDGKTVPPHWRKAVLPHWRKTVHANADLPEKAADREACSVCVLCWNRRSARWSAATPSPRPRTAGPTRVPACSRATCSAGR